MAIIVYKDSAKTMPGLPDRPSNFTIAPGENLLKGRSELVSDPIYGMTQDELDHLQDQSWWFVLVRLIPKFDVSGWDTDTPHPLHRIWELVASASYLRSVASRYSSDEESGLETPTAWEKQAEEMLQNIIDPPKERMRIYLARTTSGEIILPRNRVHLPVVVGGETIFYPRTDQFTQHGLVSDQNAETLFKNLVSGGIYPWGI